MKDCVATTPTPASAQVTSAPTANQCDCTATPISPVAGSRATIENVCTGRSGRCSVRAGAGSFCAAALTAKSTTPKKIRAMGFAVPPDEMAFFARENLLRQGALPQLHAQLHLAEFPPAGLGAHNDVVLLPGIFRSRSDSGQIDIEANLRALLVPKQVSSVAAGFPGRGHFQRQRDFLRLAEAVPDVKRDIQSGPLLHGNFRRIRLRHVFEPAGRAKRIVEAPGS